MQCVQNEVGSYYRAFTFESYISYLHWDEKFAEIVVFTRILIQYIQIRHLYIFHRNPWLLFTLFICIFVYLRSKISETLEVLREVDVFLVFSCMINVIFCTNICSKLSKLSSETIIFEFYVKNYITLTNFALTDNVPEILVISCIINEKYVIWGWRWHFQPWGIIFSDSTLNFL